MDAQETLKEKIKIITDNYEDEKIDGYITGDGPIPCAIIFVGEAPGKNEIEKRKPFVGIAGKTFEKYLNTIDLSRDKIRITNTCFFRPIKLKENPSGRVTVSNRPPKSSEVELFRNILDEEIKLVNPRIIITLGNIPLKRFTDFKSIGECHGELHFNEDMKRYIFPMYHPSSLTYNRNEKFLSMYEEDWNKLKAALKNI
ncbi:uracil-DNA glycosylase [Clostridium sp. PL3]|uniref:Uracil-DNA glycosylase n=1 Tax=Clostridium thailandense TaxID=2794346 RepID=A0A949TQD4_9CLOT|nr:uracil-DNA glycosylase [Clostridium thailandense]MBV7276999.1 uracil-DNA glycosylase [Clostridium thailandense]